MTLILNVKEFWNADISLLRGRTFQKVEKHNEFTFKTLNGRSHEFYPCLVFTDEILGEVFIFYHDQDCCEDVSIDDIVGDLSDLEGTPITLAEVVTNEEDPSLGILGKRDQYDEAYLWTFYKFATIKGYVDVKWYGTSNGYYSMGVDLLHAEIAKGA